MIWFTGLSGSGKSTLANALHLRLKSQGIGSCVLDGDILRTGLSHDLGFSDADRKGNISRAGEVAKILNEAGLVVLAAFISSFIEGRKLHRDRIGSEDFREVYLNVPLEICELRDVKGLYHKARLGLIPNFTGFNFPYEIPDHPA